MHATTYPNGTPTSYSYNTRNQLTSDGTHTFGYDKNGNRISDGTLSTVWDRAGRTLSHDGHGYAYDGEGRRIAQTTGGSTTRYVLDVQRGLPAVIGAKAGSDITHYMHGPLGMFAQRNPDSSWDWMLHDGLGNVRGVFDGTLQSAAEYDPFGEPIVAPAGTVYGFTGELTDSNGLVYLRARYLAPSFGTFASRDLWRGASSAPHTWNSYAWVEGNVVNRVDPGGLASCASDSQSSNFWDQLRATLSDIALSITQLTEDTQSTHAQLTSVSNGSVFVPKTVFLGGSRGCDRFGCRIEEEGPDPYIQTPEWVRAVDPRLVVRWPGVPGDPIDYFETAHPDAPAENIPDKTIVGKRLQAHLAAQSIIESGNLDRNINLVGYSAGADTTLIFLDEYVPWLRERGWTGQVIDVVLIGGTASGGMSGGRILDDYWGTVIREQAGYGTDFLVINDRARENVDWRSLSLDNTVPGSYAVWDINMEHYESRAGLSAFAANNSPYLRSLVRHWMTRD